MPCEALYKHTSTVLNFLMISMNAMVKMPMPKLSDAMCATLKHKMPKLDETCSLVTHRKQTLDSHDFNECHVKHCFKHTSTAKFCHDFKECHGQDVNMFFPPIRWLLAHQIHALSDAMCATSRSISGTAIRFFKWGALAIHRARLAILATSAWRSRSWQSSTIHNPQSSQNTPGQFRTSSSCR